jgi:glycosyltransferase involved in cell wall biosynthesis
VDFAASVADRIAESGLSSQVKFLGVLTGPEKFAAFRRADLFCFPSFFNCEAFPVVLLEAMAWGLPILSTKWRGIPSIVDDGVNGFLVDPHDAVALADQVERLARDVELRQAMGRAGRAKFVREFTHQRCASRMRSAFLRTAGFTVEDPASERVAASSSFSPSIDRLSVSSRAVPIELASGVAADEPASGVLL